MEENDPIESRFKTAFTGHEQEPPAEVWENLHAALHPVPQPVGFAGRITRFSTLLNLHPVFYIALSGTAFITFIAVVYFFAAGHQTIRGHAYAGSSRLDGGTAGLFKVADKAMPWDSVTHYRSAILDHYGHFQFSQIRSGNYLLRVAPADRSEAAKKYVPTWFDHHEASDSGDVIIVKGSDKNLDLFLVKRKNDGAK